MTAPYALNMGYFASLLLLLRTLGSFVVEPTYLSHVFAAYFDSIDTEIATIVHRAHGDHPKFFVA